MPHKPKNLSSDLQGMSKLSIDAIKGTTKIVESLHSTIAQYTDVLGDPAKKTKDYKTKGLTGVIYKSINGVTHLLGEGLDRLFNKTSQMHGDYSGEHKLSASREAVAAAMNGVLGDHFEKGDNPLSITMSFRVAGRTLDAQAIQSIFDSAQTVTLLIHGLCMNDLQWTRDGHNHAESLSQELGHVVIYLHYNTGLHVSENGRQLAQLLSEIKIYDKHLKLNILSHSMGGLVARSACYYAQHSQHSWLSYLHKIIFLGTPHHGALLAKGGHWADVLLQISPYSAPFATITKARSHGLTDLRHGYVIDEDWQESGEHEVCALPENVECYAIATTTSEKDNSKLANDVIGDGLVSINSALGKHKTRDLHISNENQWIGRNISHMQLLSDDKVYQKIIEFMTIGLDH